MPANGLTVGRESGERRERGSPYMGQKPNLHLHGFLHPHPHLSVSLYLLSLFLFFLSPFFPPSLLPPFLLFLTKYEVLAYFLRAYYMLGCELCFSLT